jgi:AraC-like DNA-binding protein
MSSTQNYAVNPGWQLLLVDAGINVGNVLRRAGLPKNLFTHGPKTITTEQYFALFEAIEAEAGVPDLPLVLGRALSLEAFDPPIFAATCSPNLNVAAERIARHKKLVCPMSLDVERRPHETVLRFLWPDGVKPSRKASLLELVFWVALIRLTTREEVVPLRAVAPTLPEDGTAYREFFGVDITQGPVTEISFSAEDAERPFLTASDRMWEFFEPELRRRLSELEADTSVDDQVRAALLESLPAGEASMEAVARDLAMSTRTLQRRLKEEGTTFQNVLSETRESLARHYLANSGMSAGEISFLLGYDDPRSFYRAFQSWTGLTPQLARVSTA